MSKTESSAFDAILFDLGGVLMNFGGLRRLAELSGHEYDAALTSKWVSSKWVQAFERGKCDADAFGRGVVHDWGLSLTPSEFVEEFSHWSAGPFPGAVDLLQSLHGTIRMGCLSNTNPTHWKQHLDRWGLVNYFDWAFVSHELGMMKPDADMFRHVVNTVGTTAERLLFLDDSKEHVEAARELGIRAEQTQGVDEVQDALASLLPANSIAGDALRSHMSHSLGN